MCRPKRIHNANGLKHPIYKDEGWMGQAVPATLVTDES